MASVTVAFYSEMESDYKFLNRGMRSVLYLKGTVAL